MAWKLKLPTVSLEVDLDVTIRESEHKHHRLVIPIGPVTEQEVSQMADVTVTLTDSQNVTLGPVTAVDKKGNPTSLAGPLSWSTSDSSILTITDNGDGTALASAVGPLGNAQITVTDTAATGIVNFTVIAGAEASLQVAVGTPVEQA